MLGFLCKAERHHCFDSSRLPFMDATLSPNPEADPEQKVPDPCTLPYTSNCQNTNTRTCTGKSMRHYAVC